MVLTLFYFFLALFLLVNIHEFGHFIVARLCGVSVLRFSFGFGKVLARWQDKRGTEYVWSLFPLGGYVKMLDETEAPVPESQHGFAFNRQSVWVRMAIIAAGPLFNFLFALLALWLMLVIGIQSLAPMIEAVQPGSLASQSGFKARQEIVAVNGKPIMSWRDFQYALLPHVGTNDLLMVTTESMDGGATQTIKFSLKDWQPEGSNPEIISGLGLLPFVPRLPMTIGRIVDGLPAHTAGFRVGDEITAVNGQPVSDWLSLVDRVKHSPKQQLFFTVRRQEKTLTISVTPKLVMNSGQAEGVIGLMPKQIAWPKGWLRTQRENPWRAVLLATKQTLELSGLTFQLIGRLVMGKLPLDNISGPVGIAAGAGESGRSGIAYYLSFLALVSISLGVLNLLPIPILDGGQLLYCVIELVLRRPVSLVVKTAGVYLGVMFILVLMVVGLTNDLSRLMH